LIDTLQQLQQSIDGNKRKNESLCGIDSGMDGRHGYRAAQEAQTKDFSLKVSKTASEAKEKPCFLFSFEAVFLIHISNICPFNTHLCV
jgi:hypothetical protein